MVRKCKLTNNTPSSFYVFFFNYEMITAQDMSLSDRHCESGKRRAIVLTILSQKNNSSIIIT
jgi:hypothetical protein